MLFVLIGLIIDEIKWKKQEERDLINDSIIQ